MRPWAALLAHSAAVAACALDPPLCLELFTRESVYVSHGRRSGAAKWRKNVAQVSNSARQREGTAIARTAEDLSSLAHMTGVQLAEKYLALFGESARSRNKIFLRKRLAWRIQELAEGGLSERALARIEELGADAFVVRRRPGRTKTSAPPPLRRADAGRDPRLPPVGTVVRRIHGAAEHSVTALDDGFEYRGETYSSLSKIATVITGTPWNGYLFFFGRAKGTKAQPPGRDVR